MVVPAGRGIHITEESNIASYERLVGDRIASDMGPISRGEQYRSYIRIKLDH